MCRRYPYAVEHRAYSPPDVHGDSDDVFVDSFFPVSRFLVMMVAMAEYVH